MAVKTSVIRAGCNSASFKRGERLFLDGSVLEFSQEEGVSKYSQRIKARVKGSYGNSYFVKVIYDTGEDLILDYQCECPAYDSYEGMCKHCVAVMLEYQRREAASAVQSIETGKGIFKGPSGLAKEIRTDRAVQSLIYTSSIKKNVGYMRPDETGRIELEPYLKRACSSWKLEFKIGAEVKYVLKDITEFIEHVRGSEMADYGKKLGFIHEKHAFTQKSQRIVDFLESCVVETEDLNQIYNGGYRLSYYSRIKREVVLTESRMSRFLDAVGEGRIRWEDSKNKADNLTVIAKSPVLSIKLSETPGGGYELLLPAVECFAGNQNLYVRQGACIYGCDPEFARDMNHVLRMCRADENMTFRISGDDMNAFCQVVLPVLETYTLVTKSESVGNYRPKECQIKIYLDLDDQYLTGSVYAEYGELKHNLTEPMTYSDLYRDIAKERFAIDTMMEYFTHQNQEGMLLIPADDEEHIYKLVSTGIEQMKLAGEVYISESLKRLRVLRPPKISVGVSLHAGLLDIVLDSGRLPADELWNLLKSYRLRKKYYRLPDGDFIQLEDTGLSAVAELAEGLNLDGKNLEMGSAQVPGYRVFYIDQVLRENEDRLGVKREQSFKSMLRNMRDVGDSDYETPGELLAELRPYQKFGFRWLMTLDHLGFGGILADDMGLGKTVQLIAFLLAKAGEEKKISLIVCPASLVYNWESEIRRFAPSLRVSTVVGGAKQRREQIKAGDCDIMLTSYDLLKRDIEEYEGLTFNYEIIDEAQNIKNHTTQAAKAVKAVRSENRFALTGTPIENSLGELWSIFDYLMPGILGSYKRFKENFETPISQGGDEGAAGRLKKLVKPFILRRLKKDVLRELPDKIEEVVYSKMEEDQHDLYFANAQRILDFLSGQSEEEFKTGKLKVLAELTRLRQLCCDPSLVYDGYKGSAAKVDTCMELLSNAVDSGNKVLVFSQFTSMLAILEARLKKAGIDYCILTGADSKEKRREMVDQFNGTDVPVFLISLKAGGTGLNLTAANIVIHFDPWWNMAAQNQATDRAHRIGQKQVVTVYKLIVKDTIEEKIQNLQEKKAMLSDQIISEGGITKDLVSRNDFMEMLQVEELN